MSIHGKASLPVIKRLPKYYRYLSNLSKDWHNENGHNKKDEQNISSSELARLMGTTASQVRQDFNCFGGFGQQGVGYKVDVLLAEIGTLLFGTEGERLPTILIGAGRLGNAVSSFIARDTNGYRLIGAFDVNPALVGKELMQGVTICPLGELEAFCQQHKPAVAVLCIPRQAAQELSDELVRLGIRGFWNFSHYDLSVVYPGVTVENVHLGDSLMSLGYRLRNE
ncbi:MAG: redox-sensing transcriptional repressor Rex [Gemmiger sp.]|nr:redox-sensing transcriptional repressor Rex [Gemmiger sp.]